MSAPFLLSRGARIRTPMAGGGALPVLTVHGGYADDTVNNSILRVVFMDTTDRDDLGIWDDVAGYGTMPAGSGGRWFLTWQVAYNSAGGAATFSMRSLFEINGSLQEPVWTLMLDTFNTTYTAPFPGKIYDLADGDVIKLAAITNDADGADVHYAETFLNMIRLGNTPA